MKRLFCILLLFVALTANAQKKPNIIYILADDMGWKDAGFTGSDFYITPNLDKLAKQGMVFTNAYAAAGNCAPSRACFVSGQYTPRHGVYAVFSTKRGPVKQMRLEPKPNSEELAPSVYTIAEGLQDAGYKTAIFGKWHLGKRPGTLPGDQGFDVDGSFDPPDNKDFKKTNDPKGIYRITKGACDFMEQNKDQPFFLYVSHHATHMSIQARKEMIDKFSDKEGKLQKHKSFAAMNAQMDDGIGVLLQKIKDLGLADNTLIVFTSDNGGLPESPQDPLRGYKFATFMDISQKAVPSNKTLDGQSLVSLFKQEKELEPRAIFWHFPGYLDRPNPGSRDAVFRSRAVSTIRKGDWKLLLFHEEWVLDGGRANVAQNNSVELYNLKKDLSETKNLANTDTRKRDAMLDELLKMIQHTGATMPTEKNPLYQAK